MTAPRRDATGKRINPKRVRWTAVADAQLVELYPDHPTADVAKKVGYSLPATYKRASKLGLRKSAAYQASPASCRLRRGDNVGAATRFQKGHTPLNKGVKGWQAGGRAVETQFKPGIVPHTWMPIGTEVHDDAGYRKRKVSDDRTRPSRLNWQFVHILKWERHRGPVPDGHAIVFKNGDKSDIRIANLECITRRELMLRNSVQNLPKPLRQVIQLRGAVIRQINRRSQG